MADDERIAKIEAVLPLILKAQENEDEHIATLNEEMGEVRVEMGEVKAEVRTNRWWMGSIILILVVAILLRFLGL